jgi:hypothetical protein
MAGAFEKAGNSVARLTTQRVIDVFPRHLGPAWDPSGLTLL